MVLPRAGERERLEGALSSQSYPIRLQDDVSGPIGGGAWYHLVLVSGKGWKASSLPSLIHSDYRMMFHDQ
jgi:hypothetical protein